MKKIQDIPKSIPSGFESSSRASSLAHMCQLCQFCPSTSSRNCRITWKNLRRGKLKSKLKKMCNFGRLKWHR